MWKTIIIEIIYFWLKNNLSLYQNHVLSKVSYLFNFALVGIVLHSQMNSNGHISLKQSPHQISYSYSWRNDRISLFYVIGVVKNTRARTLASFALRLQLMNLNQGRCHSTYITSESKLPSPLKQISKLKSRNIDYFNYLKMCTIVT